VKNITAGSIQPMKRPGSRFAYGNHIIAGTVEGCRFGVMGTLGADQRFIHRALFIIDNGNLDNFR